MLLDRITYSNIDIEKTSVQNAPSGLDVVASNQVFGKALFSLRLDLHSEGSSAHHEAGYQNAGDE